MEFTLFIISILSFMFCFFIILKHNIHIFQINFYKVKPQLKYIYKNISKIFITGILLTIAGIFAIFENLYFIGYIAILIIVGIINIERNVKKKIVYTARVKRLILSSYIFAFIIAAIVYIFTKIYGIVLIVLAYINVFLPLIMLFINILNLPINNMINKYYINDARKIIGNMKNLIVIGVTGSYGKTSVKNFLYKCLSAKYNVLITPENYNTTLGVVKTIRNYLKPTHEIFICEMGATNLGDIKEICDLVHPKYGIITSIGPQHLESFGSIENIIKTKFELADSIPSDGIVFLNYDNEYIKNHKIDKNVITYGVENSLLNYQAYDLKSNSSGITFKIKDKNSNEYEFFSKVIGRHNIENITGALAVANKLDIPFDKLQARVRMIEPVEHRLQIIKKGNDIIIDDAYNSNPSGSKSAVETLNTFEGVKIVVTPGMIELGDKEYELNYEFGKYCAKNADYIVLVGKKQTKPIYDGAINEKFDEQKIIVVDTLNEGLKKVYSSNVGNNRRVILLENDLPDNY